MRIAAWSLLLGAATLVTGLTLFFPPFDDAGRRAPALIWKASTAKVNMGTGSLTGGELQLTLSPLGIAIVSLSMEPIEAQDYPFLHLAIEEASGESHVAISWKTGQNQQESHHYIVESESRASVWLATEELKGWTGKIDDLSMAITGPAGDTVRIRDFSIFPASITRQLQAIFSDLTGFFPWNRAAMNTYTGVSNVSSFYPIPLTVAFLLLSLLAYGVLIVVFRPRLQFNWTVVALIFFVSWIMLDLIWQNRLLHQLVDTQRTFSGKDLPQKLTAGPDASLFGLAAELVPRLESLDSRVFVVSDDIYRGMRVAYYLYPFNVYWSLHSADLPSDNYLRKGDYIVLVKPTAIGFNRKLHLLFAEQRNNLEADLIYSDSVGTAVRLN